MDLRPKIATLRSFFNHVVGLEEVFGEVDDISARKRMNFASNPVLGKTSKYVDLRLSTINIEDKLIYVFMPVTKAEGLTNHSKWHAYRHCITEVLAYRVSKAKPNINYMMSSKFETRNCFERENILN